MIQAVMCRAAGIGGGVGVCRAACLDQEPLQRAQRATVSAGTDLRIQGSGVGDTLVVAGLQVGLERTELAAPAAGVGSDELFG
jgi:hypothetical protein